MLSAELDTDAGRPAYGRPRRGSLDLRRTGVGGTVHEPCPEFAGGQSPQNIGLAVSVVVPGTGHYPLGRRTDLGLPSPACAVHESYPKLAGVPMLPQDVGLAIRVEVTGAPYFPRRGGEA